jgi:hypothetical protein
MDDKTKQEIILKLGKDRRLAHAVLFRHRHPDATPDFHLDLIDLWNSADPRVLIMALREGAKSTVGEEEIILDACFQNFHNAMIVGETFDRAADRLRAIKHEFEYNDFIGELFGGMKGATWNEDKIILQNGICIQAKGRDQSFRGIKHLDWRPDFLWTDDFEDKESVKTPESRKYWLTVFMTVILPALDKRARVRITGTPLDEDCMLYNLRKEKMRDGKQRWTTREYPIEYRNAETGERTPIWPARYPLEHIDNLRASYEEQGLLREYMMEYMVQASNPELQKFKAEQMRVVPHIRTWQPTLAVYDPARTVKKETSSMTGHVVASWIGTKLVIWEGDGRFLMPDEMIKDLFRVDEEYSPIEIGVEHTGLNEWIMQPLRHEQTRRRVILPMRALDAPKGKIDFIGSLQPFFQAHEVEFAVECPELKKQLLSFPTGRLDAPNALAYMLKMRPGLPMLDGFGHLNVIEDLPRARNRPFYLALNADLGLTTAVLCQHVDGALWVLADWVHEGDPGEVMKGIMTDASITVAATPRPVIGVKHFRQFDTVGLVPAVKKQIVDIFTGGDLLAGRDELRKRMQTMIHSQPGLLVSTKATWTLRALAGGYAHTVAKGGMLSGEAAKNHYRVVMEGLEAFAGLLPQTANDDMDRAPHFAVNDRGIRYMTALPQGR